MILTKLCRVCRGINITKNDDTVKDNLIYKKYYKHTKRCICK